LEVRQEIDQRNWGEGNRPFARSCIVLFFLLLILKAAVTLHVWLPGYNLPNFYRSTPEFLLLLVLLGLSARFQGQRWLLTAATLLSCGLFMLSLGEGVTQYLYRRSLNLVVDFSFFPEFIRLLFESSRSIAVALNSVLFCAVLGLIFAGLFFLLRSIVRLFVESRHPGPAFLLVFFLFLMTWAVPVGLFNPKDMLTLRIARAMTGTRETLAEESGEAKEDAIAEEAKPYRRRYRDVMLFIIESYGYTAFAKQDHWDILQPSFEAFQKRLQESGYRTVSTLLQSPVIGGYSWYADSTLLTGSRISSEQQYRELLKSETPTLVGLLKTLNYRTVLAAPGTLRPWPEGEAFYRFDHTMYNVDFNYKGPDFSFVPVPDQFTLYRAHNRFIRTEGDSPLFIEYLLVSSHAPFDRIPPYVEDWSSLGDGSIYHELPVRTFKNTWFQGKEYTEGYTEAVSYVLDVVTSYLAEFVDNDTLVIITGDHQPKYPVTERWQPLSVPVHALCRDGAFLEPLLNLGYNEGLVPMQPPPHQGLEQFFSHFVTLLPDL
jgi:hypothetical protein